MNINSNIIKSTGINLGNIELATEYLYGDSTLYEPELSRIKSAEGAEADVKDITRKDVQITNEKIINKFEIEIENNLQEDIGSIDERYSSDIWSMQVDDEEVSQISKEEDKEDKEELLAEDDILEDDEELAEDEEGEALLDEDDEEELLEDDEDELPGNADIISNKTEEIINVNKKTDENKREVKNADDHTRESAVSKCSDIDGLIAGARRATHAAKKINNVVQEERGCNNYDGLELDKLYVYVKQFLVKNNVRSGPVDIALVNKQFGESNVNRLLRKCYIIKIGKGVTIGI